MWYVVQYSLEGVSIKAEWPSGLRRQTQELLTEYSGTRMCAWVRIPLLSVIIFL